MSAAPRVAVLDYGAGNLHSVVKALARSGCRPEVCADAAALKLADALVLPGAGAFKSAAAALAAKGLDAALADAIGAGRPYLGLCLGLQLLFEASDEHGTTPGLGILPGTVRRLPESVDAVAVPLCARDEASRPADHMVAADAAPSCARDEASRRADHMVAASDAAPSRSRDEAPRPADHMVAASDAAPSRVRDEEPRCADHMVAASDAAPLRARDGQPRRVVADHMVAAGAAPSCVRVPHIGWNRVTWRGAHPLLAHLPAADDYYFVHAYRAHPARAEDEVGVAEHGAPFTAAVARDNVFAVQFHPEKSQRAGLHLLEAFTRWVQA